VEAFQLNGFVKARGLELSGTYEAASGRTKAEMADRKARQYALEAVYRFGKTENLFLGARYNAVRARLAHVAEAGANPAINYIDEIKVNRVALGAGWFLTKNILLKGEYVQQQFIDFPVTDYRHGGEFSGYVLQATVGF
jgi:hypothetical protein